MTIGVFVFQGYHIVPSQNYVPSFGMTHWSLADWSIACFIDNNIQQICRTGGGPVDDGKTLVGGIL